MKLSRNNQSDLSTEDNGLPDLTLPPLEAFKVKIGAKFYKTMLKYIPNDPTILLRMGTIEVHLGNYDEGIRLLGLSLQANPKQYLAYFFRGIAYHRLDRFKEALKCYASAIALEKDNAEVLMYRNSALESVKRLENAPAKAKNRAKAPPTSSKSLSDNTGNAEKFNQLGIEQGKLQNLNEALAYFNQAITAAPDYAPSYHNKGKALHLLERLDEALASYDRAIALNPDFADSCDGRGQVLQDLTRLDEALVSFDRAIALKPDFAETHVNRGKTLDNLGRLEEALASCERAIALKPDLAEAHVNKGKTLDNLGRTEEALTTYDRAIALKPGLAEAHVNKGKILGDLGVLEEALASYNRAVALKPDLAGAHSDLLFLHSHDGNIDADSLFVEHCRFGEQFESPVRTEWPRHDNIRDPERRLQIGFVSADLRNHSVAAFIEPVLAHLIKRRQLSLHVYYNHEREDDVTLRLRGMVERWNPVHALSNAALAEKIRADGIDILIDLSGHTGGNRLAAFARKPAPLQASWMGYPGTTGLRAMDYYLADRHFLPVEQFADQFTEKIVYLPANAPFLPFAGAPAVNPLPALNRGQFTFGSFNRISKINRSVIAMWAQLLRALPDSRMLLGGLPEERQCETLLAWFALEGIARERLTLHPRSGMTSYMKLHHQVDLCLDTFPYTGGTTTCHALWMGVPTLSLAGATPGGRAGAAILGGVGLETMIAHDADDFVNKGVGWAGQLDALAAIRLQLRERFLQSAIGQPALVAEGLERALRTMWERWCAGLPAIHF